MLMDCREWKLFEILEIVLELKELLIGCVLEIKIKSLILFEEVEIGNSHWIPNESGPQLGQGIVK